MRCPTRNAAKWLSEQGHDVYLYDFAHQPGESVNWPTGTQNLGAFHGAEVPFVFNDGFELMGGEHNLSESMATYWTNMASSGDPNTWQGKHASPSLDAETTKHLERRRLQNGPPPHSKPNASAIRSPNQTHWWHYPGLDCDVGVYEHGHCSSPATCSKVCLEDEHCGGFHFEEPKKPSGGGKKPGSPTNFKLKYADCEQNMGGQGNPSSVLFFLRETAQPPPPPPQWNLPRNGNCSLFQQQQDCFHPSDGYKQIPINISIEHSKWGRGNQVNTTCLGECCSHCLEDKKCKQWFVPPPRNSTHGAITIGETVCVLMADADHKGINNSFCIGAQAPAWVPPPQCHSRFTPFNQGERVNWTASSMPPPPPPAPPGMEGCGSDYDEHRSRFLNGTVYDTIAIPKNGSMSTCCAKCTKDGKKCDGWQFGDICEDPTPPGPPPMCDPKKKETCPGGSNLRSKCPDCGKKMCQCPASKCTPPTHCKLITKGSLVNQPTKGNQTASVGKTGSGPGPFPPPPPPQVKRKIITGKTFGECCEACYYDVQDGEDNICRTWEYPAYPDPTNTTCILYSGRNLVMGMHPDRNYTGRGARRQQQNFKPPPPPPGPCATPQAVMPVKWPKYDEGSDTNIKFDLCNVTIETALKADACVFWNSVFPINASYPPGETHLSATQAMMHRLRTPNKHLNPLQETKASAEVER